jgi:phosphotransferase system IIA component
MALPVAGKVYEMAVVEGQTVNQGKLLARLEENLLSCSAIMFIGVILFSHVPWLDRITTAQPHRNAKSGL